ncbi:hypothetical protein MJO29_002442 [Puccinia striiformis f. sp. tritici]|uniref:hypothetical protein n=1 Tax=Puccinia striiformis f. sp. tritici TaxID=168172 RepID=UPI0020077112|nr:hypothetical protein Pst134EA_002437 [Puccinia striiformis f. sp. tritici]KAH9464015.1 hypothetical protein Pst134EB_003555 [Puccinia striiformis f. sp. tritici]KAH9471798.1 hypothetical protein Pst134EA_002437 [Puccinia striiformis f. sp. tritici]KAI7966694.1 hypothetical protein MJO29_002442 [Puccinia striiformis f. sp. tritici]
MAKRKKNRTHKKGKEAATAAAATSTKSPKSFIIKSTRAHHTSASATRSPHHSTSLNLLVKDFRKVMEPNTASHLRERKSNKFKDFLAMAGPLSVTHIIVFSQSEMSTAKQLENQAGETEMISNLNLKIYKVPRGPTLTFKILRFSLMIDILNADKHARSPGAEFKTEPLLIMNNFNPDANATAEDINRLNLLTTTFRNLFPQIKVHEIQLVQTRRVVLLSYNPTTRTIDFRHFLITVKPIGVSKALRKLMQGVSAPGQRTEEKSDKRNKHLLNLGSIEDVAEYLLGKGKGGPGSTASSSGFTGDRSENTEDGNQSDYDGLSSEGEDESEGEEAEDRRVQLPQNYLGRGNIKNTKKAIRLKEIGPRMELGLIKIEQGLGGGDVLYHELIKKSKGEDQKIKKKIKEKETLKSKRKKEQEENVKKKAMEKEAKKKPDKKAPKQADDQSAGQEGEANEEEADNDDDEEEEEEEGSEIDEDAELSDIFSELAYSEGEDSPDDKSMNSSDEQQSDESDAEPEPPTKEAPKTSNKRKKVKFSKS